MAAELTIRCNEDKSGFVRAINEKEQRTPGLVTSLGGDDRPRDGEVLLVLDERGGSEVGRDTNALEDSGESGERLRVGVREPTAE